MISRTRIERSKRRFRRLSDRRGMAWRIPATRSVLLALALSGCVSPPEPPPRIEIVTRDVPVAVPCDPKMPEKVVAPTLEELRATDAVGFIALLWNWWLVGVPYAAGLERVAEECRRAPE